VVHAVTFDFWETIARDTPEGIARAREARLATLAAVLRRAGSPRGAGEIEDAYERCGAAMAARYWSAHRDCAIRDQVRLFFECLDPGLASRLTPEDLEVAVEGYATPVLRWPPVLQPGADAAIRALAGRGMRLGIVSNTGRTPGVVLRRVLEGWGLLGHFHAVSYSDEVGVRKPSPVIFERTLAALGVAASGALHVGDNPHDDVLGARGAGMLAAHYVPDGRPPSADANLVVADLGDLPERLDALGG
jgi:putative hydrolase of the HAD superfamily